ncbi:hypothetical protein KCU67_g28, partial [Aureobasidium melanogenum]
MLLSPRDRRLSVVNIAFVSVVPTLIKIWYDRIGCLQQELWFVNRSKCDDSENPSVTLALNPTCEQRVSGRHLRQCRPADFYRLTEKAGWVLFAAYNNFVCFLVPDLRYKPMWGSWDNQDEEDHRKGE